MLKIELKEAISELKKLKAKRVFLQIPEGLKIRVEEIIEQLTKEGFEIFTSMDPCFGACDLKQKEAKQFDCDAILHLGHSQFLEKTIIPVVYAHLEYDLGKEFDKLIQRLVKYLKKEKIAEIGLTTTIQFLHYLPKIREILENEGIDAEIGKGRRSQNGQVLGCNYSSAEIKAKNIIYFGDGLFHPLGIHFATGKRVILTNPFEKEIKELNKEKDSFLRQRILLIEKAKEATNYAIIVSTKEGQNKNCDAIKIKKELENLGKKANIYSMDFVSNDALLGLKAEAIINTACPRISIDDFKQYKLPIINKDEVEYLLGKRDYENYKLEVVY